MYEHRSVILRLYETNEMKALRDVVASHCQWCDAVRMIHKKAHVLMCLNCDMEGRVDAV